MSDEKSELEQRLLKPARAVKPEQPEEDQIRIESEARKAVFDLLFVDGLYASAALTASHGECIEDTLRSSAFGFDSYCKNCKRETTFRIAAREVASRGLSGRTMPDVKVIPPSLLSISATCQRDQTVYSYVLRFEKDRVMKIGQWPSTADIAFGELRQIDKALDGDDRQELGKALGLYAHDAAIGAFVYLRRVFERMVTRAHQRQADSGSAVDGFETMRMDEKIAALKDELPERVVKHSAIFSVLSVGIHELNEDQCNKYFPVMKAVLFQMLEQEEHKRKAAMTARETDNAIQGILGELGDTKADGATES
ncbi:MAG: hypothetical protein ACN4E6_01590 [Qipengyuania pacifica]